MNPLPFKGRGRVGMGFVMQEVETEASSERSDK